MSDQSPVTEPLDTSDQMAVRRSKRERLLERGEKA